MDLTEKSHIVIQLSLMINPKLILEILINRYTGTQMLRSVLSRTPVAFFFIEVYNSNNSASVVKHSCSSKTVAMHSFPETKLLKHLAIKEYVHIIPFKIHLHFDEFLQCSNQR